MRPLMYSVNDAENKNIGWRRWGEEIVYYRNNLSYYLHFYFYFIINYNLVHLMVLQQICIPSLGHVNFQITPIHIILLIVIHIHILIYK